MTTPKPSSQKHCTVDLRGLSPFETLSEKLAQQFDPFGVTTSLLNAQIAWWLHPQELTRVLTCLSGDALALQAHIMRRAWGLPSTDVVTPEPGDARFADPAWAEVPTWDIAKETYLAITHRLQDMYFETPGLSDKERRRAAFWLRKWLNAMAPTNFFWTNPVALRKFAETNGESVARGFQHYLEDIRAGNIRMVDEDAFAVGKDLATTPGQVVFRNRLVEVIQYTPTTDKVRAIPLVIFPPWINKFYILDLNAKKSLVSYLVGQGFTVFLASWKNPTPEMAEVSFDDYLQEGYQKVIEAATAIAKVPQVHAIGYCIGGTGLTAYLAWANRHYGDPAKVPVAHWTTLTTLTDFARPGDIEVFLDEGAVEWLEQKMAKQGYLDGKDMASSFRMLRSNSLIWHYWVHSYLYGEPLPPFDVLFWNSDTTRMPRAMHSYYLREMYLKNNLIKKDAMTLSGEPLDMTRIVQPLFAVTAEDDHIAPWRQCFHIRRHIPAPMRFVLSTSGHILGIVNPPVDPPKRAYWMGDVGHGQSSEAWQEGVSRQEGSWWPAWVAWLDERCGERVAPPKPHRAYPALGAAPGTYVLES
ncbi:poly-beta-hydroxybutyrate synthase [Oryzomicrobium terrae]|uniref:Poly-beta-hydroxybutyrate synthase n=1 Tax=Oryzomicrobium terrae TaxID=1735038 RepID=A0A5C1E5U7_9RHOO|nr:alpha/beta fold hydrolase [Oryzomicrobium terrae]QEL64302.1 poly-beta-hydroxybutyrate synthase [Oryzomicrobium terrae]